jgi:hypothetical protein
MDRWAWEQLDPWLEIRHQLPIGALLCVIHGPTAGRRWEASAARKQLHHAERGRGETPLRATPTAPRSRGRNGARRRSARSHPASTWACQPGDHQRLPAGHRYQRDHQHRPRTALTNDLRHRRAPDDSIDQSATGSALVDVGPIRRYTPGRRDARQTSSTVPRPAFVWARAAEPARSS